MRLYLDGNYIDLNYCYSQLFPKVKVFITSNSGNEAEAQDIFQEALLAAWQNVNKGSFKGDKSDFEAYIYQIAKYKWLDILKSKYRKSTHLTDELERLKNDREEDYKEVETKHLLQAVAKLGEICRELLQMFYYQKLSLEEIGKNLGYNKSVAKTKKYRCMQKLRKIYLENYVNQK